MLRVATALAMTLYGIDRHAGASAPHQAALCRMGLRLLLLLLLRLLPLFHSTNLSHLIDGNAPIDGES